MEIDDQTRTTDTHKKLTHDRNATTQTANLLDLQLRLEDGEEMFSAKKCLRRKNMLNTFFKKSSGGLTTYDTIPDHTYHTISYIRYHTYIYTIEDIEIEIVYTSESNNVKIEIVHTSDTKNVKIEIVYTSDNMKFTYFSKNLPEGQPKP